MDFSFVWKYRYMYLEGAGVTIALSFFSVLAGVVFGLLFALMRLSKFRVLRAIATTYIELIRGTPLLVQVMIIYYGMSAAGLELPAFIAGIVTMTINSSAYVAEIIRAGIQAVDGGQMEAAQALGMSHTMAMRLIILPQAFRNILPALANEFITVIKESSVVSFIAVGELMYKAIRIRGVTFLPYEPFIVAALIYFIITFALSKLLRYFERRMQRGDRNIQSAKKLR